MRIRSIRPSTSRDFVLPTSSRGSRSGRARKNFKIAAIAFAIVGHNQEEQNARAGAVRQQISFYASTRTYRVVLETHGWGAGRHRLNEKAAKGEWAAMASEITDEMLDVYSVTGTWDDIGDKVKKRYDGCSIASRFICRIIRARTRLNGASSPNSLTANVRGRAYISGTGEEK